MDFTAIFLISDRSFFNPHPGSTGQMKKIDGISFTKESVSALSVAFANSSACSAILSTSDILCFSVLTSADFPFCITVAAMDCKMEPPIMLSARDKTRISQK